MNASVNTKIPINPNPLVIDTSDIRKYLANDNGTVVGHALLAAILHTGQHMSTDPGEAIRVLIDRILQECENDKAYKRSMLDRLDKLPSSKELPLIGKARTRIKKSINQGANVLRMVDGSSEGIRNAS